jgi:hypothetical protein
MTLQHDNKMITKPSKDTDKSVGGCWTASASPTIFSSLLHSSPFIP